MYSCGNCTEEGGKDTCTAKHPELHYGCTRNANHIGNHIACGVVNHNIVSWPNENETIKTS